MKKLEQLLAEGYQTMAELNLSISFEQFAVECEACETGEHYFSYEDGE